MHAHVCCQDGAKEELAETRARLRTIEQEAEVIMAHDLHDERIVHLLKDGFVVIDHR